jgi:hypothetical protein
VDKRSGFSLDGPDCTRGPVMLVPFDVVRFSERRDG